MTDSSSAASPLFQRYAACPLCGATQVKPGLSVRATGHALYRPGLPAALTWLRCTACDHEFTEHHFTRAGLDVLFQGANAEQLPGAGDAEAQRHKWAPTIERVVAALPDPSAIHHTSPSWWDVGCGAGGLVMTAAEFGFEAVGLDLRPAVVDKLMTLGYRAFNADFLTAQLPGSPAVLSMADVLEHTAFPAQYLRRAFEVLAPGGLLLVCAPNRDTAAWAQSTKALTNAYLAEIEHHHNFSRARLVALLHECGFEVVRYAVSSRYRSGMELIARKPGASSPRGSAPGRKWGARLSHKRLIFSVTAGRTATQMVSALFATLPGVRSEHEAEPNFLRAMRPGQAQPALRTAFLEHAKLPALEKIGEAVYVETSHLACKGFLGDLLALGVRPDLILLRRDPRKIAFSLLERATVPMRTPAGTSWLLAPGDPDTLPIDDPSTLTDYQLCFWYAVEIERRQAAEAVRFSAIGARVVDTSADALRSLPEWKRVLRDLELPCALDEGELARRHAEVSGQIWNKNRKPLDQRPDFDAEEAEVWRRVGPIGEPLRADIARRYPR